MIVGITRGGPGVCARIAEALAAGLDRALVREDVLPDGIAEVARAWPGRVVLHTRMPGALDAARTLPVAVHFASTAPPAAWAVGLPFSVSTHTVDEARAAVAAGAAWVFLSPIWASPSKPGDTRPPLGTAGLGAAPRAVALGGVDPTRVRACRDAGAFGVAGMGGLFGTTDVTAAVRAWREAWDAR